MQNEACKTKQIQWMETILKKEKIDKISDCKIRMWKSDPNSNTNSVTTTSLKEGGFNVVVEQYNPGNTGHDQQVSE